MFSLGRRNPDTHQDASFRKARRHRERSISRTCLPSLNPSRYQRRLRYHLRRLNRLGPFSKHWRHLRFPGSRAYSNAWDSVPSIKRYASRLVKPPPPPPSMPSFAPRGSRRRSDSYRSRSEQSDANSMDGDVEDEVDDDEDEEEEKPGRLSSGERSEKGSKTTSSKRDRERNGSKSPPSGSYRPKSDDEKKEYRSLGVQTLPKDVRSIGVQVAQPASLPPTGNNHGKVADEPSTGSGRGGASHKKAGKMRQRTSSSSTSGTSISSIGSHIELAKPAVVQDLKLQQEQLASSSPGLANVQSFIRPPASRQQSGQGQGLPSGALSPRLNETNYAQVSPNRTPTNVSPLQTGNTSPSGLAKPALQNIQTSVPQQQAPLSMSNPPSLIARTSSTDTTESIGPLSPVDSFQVPSVIRKSSGRSWNPATGVDVFKRGSEEVLARFLRMGSWEEESPTGAPSQSHGGLRT